MGYNATFRIRAREVGVEGARWRTLTKAERKRLRAYSDSADYVVSQGRNSGHGKWYEAKENLRRLSTEMGLTDGGDVLEFRASITGEDGARWRIYAKSGKAVTIYPKTIWPKDPWAEAEAQSKPDGGTP